MRCFVVMPFGKKGSPKFKKFYDVYKFIVEDALQPLGYECERADEIPEIGSIPEQIKSKLRDAELVVADLSERNPNVFYEVGIRHALDRPIITLSQDDLKELPFDVSHYRTIQYTPSDLESVSECKRQLTACVHALRTPPKGAKEKKPEVGIPELDRKLEIGFDNVFRTLSSYVRNMERMEQNLGVLSEATKRMTGEFAPSALSRKVEELISSSNTLLQVAQLGLVGIYKNRPDAIEEYFYEIMRDEVGQISIVGSTIFGLKGYRSATFENVMELLSAKIENGIDVRILLTHWDYIAFRQDQEKTDKNIGRYVISKELKDAVDTLKARGMEKCLRFYKGSPTCFTIVCSAQKLMLMNPYPYQSEAYNSWCVIVRDTVGGMYESFKSAHVDDPWDNSELVVKYDEAFYESLLKKFAEDIRIAQTLTLGQLSGEDLKPLAREIQGEAGNE